MDTATEPLCLEREEKVVMDVLRVKEPGKQFTSFEYAEYTTWAIEIITFLKVTLKLESVQVYLNGQPVDLFDGYSRTEFKKYFNNNEIVDLLIPRNIPAHRIGSFVPAMFRKEKNANEARI